MTAKSPQLPLYDWSVATSADASEVSSLPSGIPGPMARLLLQRGLADANDPASLAAFLEAPLTALAKPGDVPGVDEAARAILETIDARGQIVIFGDFDCDGITATALLTSLLRFVGADVFPFIPERAEGYGLTDEAVTRCLDAVQAARPDAPCRLLVTVDCGMGAGDSLQRFLDAGYRVVVSDHHTPGEPLPEACTVISNFDPAMPPRCRYLCGAGLAYKIACGAITMRYPQPDRTGRAELHQWMGALAIATVADVVPLVGENRVYVREGLVVLNRRPGTGLKALIRRAFERAQPQITAYHLGYVLGPHINASGRMETAEPALRLLLAEDDDEANAQALRLSTLNTTRKNTEQLVLKEIDGKLADPSLFDEENDGAVVIAGRGWHPGIVGLAAGRVAERFTRPSVVISIDDEGNCHGSARAPEKYYNLYDALSACSSLLTRFGGHASAAGLSLREENLAAFRSAFCSECVRQAGATHIRPELVVDGVLAADDLDDAFMGALARLEPCGNGNEKPCWMLEDVEVKADVIGKEKTHLRLRLLREDGLDLGGVWFGAAEYATLFGDGGRWDVVGELAENEYRGDTEIQIVVRDARPHSGPRPVCSICRQSPFREAASPSSEAANARQQRLKNH